MPHTPTAPRSSELTILEGEFSTHLQIACIPGIKAGFPSPAADYENASIDFNHDMIKHPESTFYAVVRGDSMTEAGIDEGDVIVVDRAQEPEDGDVVVAMVNGEFTLKFLDRSHLSDGYIELVPANPRYEPIRVVDSDQFMVWGVVVWTLRHRKNMRIL